MHCVLYVIVYNILMIMMDNINTNKAAVQGPLKARGPGHALVLNAHALTWPWPYSEPINRTPYLQIIKGVVILQKFITNTELCTLRV